MISRSPFSILCHPLLRWIRLALALALLLGVLATSAAATPLGDPTVDPVAPILTQIASGPVAASITQTEAKQRLQTIATQMESIRFCRRSSGCKYRDITVEVRPDTRTPFVGEINAIMDRPSAVLDRAHYQFEFKQDRWHLLGGEELSDVSSFFFEGDEYEVFSSYSARTRIAKLSNASATLRVGYKDLYYQVLDRGVERDPA